MAKSSVTLRRKLKRSRIDWTHSVYPVETGGNAKALPRVEQICASVGGWWAQDAQVVSSGKNRQPFCGEFACSYLW